MSETSINPKTFAILDEDLDEINFSRLSEKSDLAIDTEAMGLIHGRDRLCLIQICDSDDNVVCIRIKLEQKSAPLLQKLLENQKIEKIFHFARFDVAALSVNLGIETRPIFCTKIASKLARTYSPRHGLKEVILELLGIELDKQSQSSDWGKTNELSKKQLIYAANDVRYLIPAKQKLKEMLLREKRWNLAENCFSCIPTISNLDVNRFNNIFDH